MFSTKNGNKPVLSNFAIWSLGITFYDMII